MFRYGYSCGKLHEAVAKAEAFWGPVLADGPSGEDVAAGPAWDPGSWAWGATPPIP